MGRGLPHQDCSANSLTIWHEFEEYGRLHFTQYNILYRKLRANRAHQQIFCPERSKAKNLYWWPLSSSNCIRLYKTKTERQKKGILILILLSLCRYYVPFLIRNFFINCTFNCMWWKWIKIWNKMLNYSVMTDDIHSFFLCVFIGHFFPTPCPSQTSGKIDNA